MALRKASGALEIHAIKSITSLQMCPSDFAVLGALLQKGPQPVNTLGKELLLTSGSITIAIDRLEKRQLVERRWQQDDRRVCLVSLTSDGEKLIGSTFQSHAAEMLNAFSGLSNSERKSLLALVEKAALTTHAALTGKPVQKAAIKSGNEEPAPKPAMPAKAKGTPAAENAGFAGFTDLD